MVSQNCPAVSQNFWLKLKQLLTAVSSTNLKIGGLSKLLDGYASQTLKKHWLQH